MILPRLRQPVMKEGPRKKKIWGQGGQEEGQRAFCGYEQRSEEPEDPKAPTVLRCYICWDQ
jgi:hypothetical protein